MPHSVTSEAMSSSPSTVKDEPMEETGITAPAADGDVDMAEAGVEDVKKEVKQLEDLFDDDNSDDEFPSSAPVQPSSQVAPTGSPT